MSTWTLAYDAFSPEEEGLREALTSTGNGYFCTRGACEWAPTVTERLPDPGPYYPGTYMHGGFNRVTTMVAGRPVINEDFVNLPNWLPLQLSIEGGPPFDLATVEILSYQHTFDTRSCTVSRIIRFRDQGGRETTLASRRFVSMACPHEAALEWTITPETWSGNIQVTTALDGRTHNWGTPRYRDLESRHLRPLSTSLMESDGISLLVETTQSRIAVAMAARTLAYQGEDLLTPAGNIVLQSDGYVERRLSFPVVQGKPLRIEKLVAFYSSRDNAISEPLVNAETTARRLTTFAEAYEPHVKAWNHLWDACDIEIPQDDEVQRIVRLHINHVLQCCSPNTADLDAGVPARGLNGESYRGHIFWDELYIFPYLTSRLPDVTKGLLMYRYRRLDEARALAKAAGYRGAMFPWQSGSDGSEETQVVHLNPKSGSWDPDLSQNQRHVSAAIFFNVWQYYRMTGDDAFLARYGAEIMLEIARFWASIAHYNTERGRYEIHGVMGPDEFHEQVYGNDAHGVPNNAYTNVMVAWISETACRILDIMPSAERVALADRLNLNDDEIRLWQDMGDKMFIPTHADGLISQFEGYEELDELDWTAYRAKYDNIHRMDRILKAEGETPDRYKVAKQADTLMLWYLFPEPELRALLERLGYAYGDNTALAHTNYYYERCSHGSTLSLIVHADIERALDPAASWDMFLSALGSDVHDIQGGTTREGIHMGVMAGTLDLIQRGYMGLSFVDGTIHLNPKLPEPLDGLTFRLRYNGEPILISQTGNRLTVTSEAGPITVAAGGTTVDVASGSTHTFRL